MRTLAFLSTILFGLVPALHAQEEQQTNQEESQAVQEQAQETQEQESDAQQQGAAEFPPELQAYVDLKKSAKAIDEEINEIYGSLSFGLPKRQKAQQERIKSLKLEQQELTLKIFEAAVEAFRVSDPVDRVVTRDMMAYANACLNGNGFRFPINPAKTLGICQLVIDKGADVPQVHALAARAAFSAQDFAAAKNHLKRVVELGGRVDEKFAMVSEQAIEAFEKESQQIAQDKNLPRVSIKLKKGDADFGTIILELFEDQAPQTVANFIWLIDQNFYDEKIFFDVRRGEYVRCGCPKNNGTGNAGHEIFNEAPKPESRKCFSGYISMVPSNGTNGNCGSQFIIAQTPLMQLTNYPVFGRVSEGMEVLQRINGLLLDVNGNPEPSVRISEIEVLYRRPGTQYTPTIAKE